MTLLEECEKTNGAVATGTSSSTTNSGADRPAMTDTRLRVKLYALNSERQWDDKGTGHVSSSYVERLKGISLLVRAESDGSLLLESKIQPNTAYQKQQQTLIVWSEGDNFDLALSFQERAGCDEIWEKICQVQGKDPSVEVTQEIIEESEDERLEDERFEDMSDSALLIELPPAEMGRLEEISELISSCLHSPVKREKLALEIASEGYVKKLINIFHMCEDLENIEGLHHLNEIFKNIFLLNKIALFQILFADDVIMDVIGCLEYDPLQPQPKRHREYLNNNVQFKEVIPISNHELLSKIHQTFRVHYIQDVVLPTPSVFEENMLSTLTSFIFLNKVEIVSLIQDDDKFLNELFALLTDESTEDSKRKDLMSFLKEFCTFSQNLQPPSKESFFKTLSSLGILSAIEIALSTDDEDIKTTSIHILSYIVESYPSMVREYILQQGNNPDEDQQLIHILIDQMTCDTDPELGSAVQLNGILRLLLDPENMVSTINKAEKTDFLNFFYKQSMHMFIAPLLANTSEEKPTKEDYQTVQLLGLILETLSFCVECHTYHIKNYIIHRDLLRRVLVLMKSKHTFLVLAALRFMRKIIGVKDEFYNRYIIRGNLFAPVFDALIRNNGRYNLLDSAILEMFEFINLEDIKTLCAHVVENFEKSFDKINYVETFKSLKLKYEQQQDRIKNKGSGLDSMDSLMRNRAHRLRRDPRQLDEKEEMWFNDSDNTKFAEDTSASSPPSSYNSSLDIFTKTEIDNLEKLTRPSIDSNPVSVSHKKSPTPNNGNLSNLGAYLYPNRGTGDSATANPITSTAKTNLIKKVCVSSDDSETGERPVLALQMGGLVDYEGDSDEEEEEEDTDAYEDQHSNKRPKLS